MEETEKPPVADLESDPESDANSNKSSSSIEYRSSSAEPIEPIPREKCDAKDEAPTKSASRSPTPEKVPSGKDGKLHFRRKRPYQTDHARRDDGYCRNRYYPRNNNNNDKKDYNNKKYGHRREYSSSPGNNERKTNKNKRFENDERRRDHEHPPNHESNINNDGTSNQGCRNENVIMKPSDIKNSAKQSAKSFLDMLQERKLNEAFVKQLIVPQETKKIAVKIHTFVNTFNSLNQNQTENGEKMDADSNGVKNRGDSPREEGEIISDSEVVKQQSPEIAKKKTNKVPKKSNDEKRKNDINNGRKRKKKKKNETSKKSKTKTKKQKKRQTSDSSGGSQDSSASSYSSSSESSDSDSDSDSSETDSSNDSSSSSSSSSTTSSSSSSSSSSYSSSPKKKGNKRRKRKHVARKKATSKLKKRKTAARKSQKNKKSATKKKSAKKFVDQTETEQSDSSSSSSSSSTESENECQPPVDGARIEWPKELILLTKTIPSMQFAMNPKHAQEFATVFADFDTNKLENNNNNRANDDNDEEMKSNQSKHSPQSGENDGEMEKSSKSKRVNTANVKKAGPMKLDMNNDYQYHYEYYHPNGFPHLEPDEQHKASSYYAYYQMFNSNDYSVQQLAGWAAQQGFNLIETNMNDRMTNNDSNNNSLDVQKTPKQESAGIKLEDDHLVETETKKNPIPVITTNCISSSISSDFLIFQKMFPNGTTPDQDLMEQKHLDSPPLSPPPLRPKMTVLEATEPVQLPNGVTLPAGTKQIIVHPYNRPIY